MEKERLEIIGMKCIKRKRNITTKREKYGMRNSLSYNSWRGAKERCSNPNHKNYDTYGAKGITFCKKWTESFMAFIIDMGERPSKEFTLDRIDNSQGYFKENCRWVHYIDQHNNMGYRKDAVFLTLYNITLTLQEWSRVLEVNSTTLYYRKKQQWTDEEVLTTPICNNQYDRRLTNGKGA